MSAVAALEADLTASVDDVTRRGRILREARALFTAQGFAAVSMQQIADAAAVNKATLYHHFRDKEDLFASVMSVEFARMTATVNGGVDEGGNLREQMQRVALRIMVARRSDFGRLVADLHMHVSEETRAALIARFPPPWDHVRAILERAKEAGEVRDVDAELVARTFFAMVGSQVWWAKFGPIRPEPDDRLAATLTDLLMHGIARDH